MTDGMVMTIGSGCPYGLKSVNHNLPEQLNISNGKL